VLTIILILTGEPELLVLNVNNMKKLYVSLIFMSLFLQVKAQDYNGFLKFVYKNFKVTPEMRRNCDWQYAIVKLKTDLTKKITSVEILNNDANKIKGDFNFLIGYKFENDLPVKKRSVIFCYTLENQNLGRDCAISPEFHQPSDVMMKILNCFNVEQKKEPSTIFIYQPVFCILYATEK
jgi:hypothetical protein